MRRWGGWLVFALVLAGLARGQVAAESAEAKVRMSPPARDVADYVPASEWWRFGVAAPLGITGYTTQLADLRAGAYLDFGNSLAPARPGGIEYIQLLRVRNDLYPGVLTNLPALVAANPGAYWEIGNEPDTTYGGQDNVTPETYADRFYAVATQIRSLDATAKIGFGTLVQPTPIRLRYLDRAWQRLIDNTGSPAAASGLIDFWNVHAFILNEWPLEWGTGVPPGFICETAGLGRCWDDFQGPVFDCNANPEECWLPVHYTVPPFNETHNNAIFEARVVALRQWMANIGQQAKPLWITEYGNLFPPIGPSYLVPDSETARFMTESFDFLLSATDPAIGYPADGNRLVQRWFWYSLNEHRYTFGGTLYDPDNGKAITQVGTAWIDYFLPQILGDPDAAVTGKLAVGTATPGNKALTVVGVIDFLGAGTVHNYFTQGGGNNMQINSNVDEANLVGDATRAQWKLVLGTSLDQFSLRRSPASGTYNEDALFFIDGATGNVGIATVDTGNLATIPFTTQARLHVETESGDAIRGVATSTADGTYGVYGRSDSEAGIGVYGLASATTGLNYGVYGQSDADPGIGVYGSVISTSGSSYAGYLSGNVHANGLLTKSAGGFRIDHPLDPAEKYLQHAFVESPDMTNLYTGVVTLGEDGEAWVELPEWFEALNEDFRYALMPIGEYAALYVAEGIEDNRFKVAGGVGGMEVSWFVTGIRHDPYAEENRIEVEQDKPEAERGTVLYPELYGESFESTAPLLQVP